MIHLLPKIKSLVDADETGEIRKIIDGVIKEMPIFEEYNLRYDDLMTMTWDYGKLPDDQKVKLDLGKKKLEFATAVTQRVEDHLKHPIQGGRRMRKRKGKSIKKKGGKRVTKKHKRSKKNNKNKKKRSTRKMRKRRSMRR